MPVLVATEGVLNAARAWLTQVEENATVAGVVTSAPVGSTRFTVAVVVPPGAMFETESAIAASVKAVPVPEPNLTSATPVIVVVVVMGINGLSPLEQADSTVKNIKNNNFINTNSVLIFI